MLCQFTVKNYKSIRDEATLDMQAASISEHNDSLIICDDGEKFLPVSVIYGPNGGGKSNVLEAINGLIDKVLLPVLSAKFAKLSNAQREPIVPFLFSEETANEPTEFEIFFRGKLAEYRYCLNTNYEKIVYESLELIKFDTHRRSTLFTRNDYSVEDKGMFAKYRIEGGMSDELPFISYLMMTQKNEIISDIYNTLFYNMMYMNYGDYRYDNILPPVETYEEQKKLILSMFKEMDIDIVDFKIKEKNGRIEVTTTHEVDGKHRKLELHQESSGTQKLFTVLPLIATMLTTGGTLIADELDAKVHPSLLKYIIKLFTNKESNKNGAQLIFTSHELSTMTSELFRRDEIWFVAKGNAQNSRLYSLVELKNENGDLIRKDAKYDKQYLEGRYGADPYLKKIINWEKEHGKSTR